MKSLSLVTLLLCAHQAGAQTIMISCDYRPLPQSGDAPGTYTIVIEPWHNTAALDDLEYMDGKPDPLSPGYTETVIINEATIDFSSLKPVKDGGLEGVEYFINRLTGEFWKAINGQKFESGSCQPLHKSPMF